MDRQTAIAFLGYMIGRLGGGYHPDTSLDQYINHDNSQSFSLEEIATLQPLHDQMLDVLGEESYSIGLKLFDIALGLNAAGLEDL